MNDILIQDIPEGIELIAVPENDKTSNQEKYIEKLKEINKVYFKDIEIHYHFGETGIDRKTKGVMTGITLVRTK